MKLASYLKDGQDQLAFYFDGYLFDTDAMHPELPSSLNMFLTFWDDNYIIGQAIYKSITEHKISLNHAVAADDVQLLSPIPFPASCRDAYAFRQHVEAARRSRNAPMLPEFDQFPVFYFTNHHSVQGAGEIKVMPDHLDMLDFELEAAVVIAKPGRNIRAEEADEYIAGIMIMNDMSARRLQMEEMRLNLGPAKGKDFCTVFGPCLVTLDELEEFETEPQKGHTGKNWSLPMRCTINGVEVSSGNLGDMEWTFAEIIERCSYGADLHAGDVIGSGTVGTGCFLELNATAKQENPGYQEQWLKEGDIIEMEIDCLGILQNNIVKEEDDFSLLALKKNTGV
ncbi:MAG TPA: fumarylacetoacetate hydrolase family protein [Chitinophagaceae bacterium]|nr:fumarylacetoacetate hydrolase family protein [Chitinophagaceae bacterium]